MAAIDLNLCKSADNHRPFEFASDGRSTRVSSFHFVDSLFSAETAHNKWMNPLTADDVYGQQEQQGGHSHFFSAAKSLGLKCRVNVQIKSTALGHLVAKFVAKVDHQSNPLTAAISCQSADEVEFNWRKMKRRQNFELFGASSPNRRPPPAEVCERLNGVHRATAHFWPPPAGWLAAVPQSHLTLDCWAAPRQRWKEAQFLLTSHWFISLEFCFSKSAPTQKCWHGLCNREGYQWCICY